MRLYELYKKYIGKTLVLKMVLTVFSILVFYLITRKIKCKSLIKCETINIFILFICITLDYIFSKLFIINKEINRNKYAISTILFIVSNIISLMILYIFMSKHLIIKFVLSYIIALIVYKISLIKIKKNVDIIKTINIIFVSIFFFILSIGTYTILVEKNDKSLIENRKLTQFKIPTLDTFKDKTFQSNLEDSLADQYIFGLKIKELSLKYLNLLDYKNINKKICSNRYVKVSSNYATYNCGDYIVNYPKGINGESKKYKDKINVLNELNKNIDTYYYVINRAYTIDFENKTNTFDLADYLKNNLEGDYKIGILDNYSYENYTKLFFKTDHHWNYEGSYQGYKEIHDLLDIDEDYIKPSGVKSAKNKFFGSTAKLSKMVTHGETFNYYTFDYEEHAVYLNGRKGLYTNTNRNTSKKYTNYYELIYGRDGVILEYNFNDSDKDNLLIIASSYSNPINELIASHFNKTYVLDLRAYRNDNNSPINLKEYIKWNKIDKVLVIASTDVFDTSSVAMEWID